MGHPGKRRNRDHSSRREYSLSDTSLRFGRPPERASALCGFDAWVLTLLDNPGRVEPAPRTSSKHTRSAPSLVPPRAQNQETQSPRCWKKIPRTRVTVDEKYPSFDDHRSSTGCFFFAARPRYFTDPNLHSAAEGSGIAHLGPVQFDQPCKIWHSSKCTNTSLSLSQPGAEGERAS